MRDGSFSPLVYLRQQRQRTREWYWGCYRLFFRCSTWESFGFLFSLRSRTTFVLDLNILRFENSKDWAARDFVNAEFTKDPEGLGLVSVPGSMPSIEALNAFDFLKRWTERCLWILSVWAVFVLRDHLCFSWFRAGALWLRREGVLRLARLGDSGRCLKKGITTPWLQCRSGEGEILNLRL